MNPPKPPLPCRVCNSAPDVDIGETTDRTSFKCPNGHFRTRFYARRYDAKRVWDARQLAADVTQPHAVNHQKKRSTQHVSD